MDTSGVLLLVLSCLCLFLNGNAIDLPAGIHRCSIKDENCLRDGMNFVIKNFAKTGIKELGMVQLDPLHIKKFNLGKNPNSPVSIDLSFVNADLLGLGDAHVDQVSAFTHNLTRPIVFDMVSPRVTLKGPYSIEGKVLILPIVGKGNAKIVLDDCKVHAVVNLTPVVKGPGQTYAKVVSVQMTLDPSHVTYRLENLFNGQQDLARNLHALINENGQDVFNELKGDISGAMGLIFRSVLNKIFSKLSLEQLFIDG